MLTKQVFVLLSTGGGITASRTFPHPYHYHVTGYGAAALEVTADDIVELLERKRIEAPHVSQWGDAYQYRIVDQVFIRDQALKGFTFGFGVCSVCHALPIGSNASGHAARHGHTREKPACEGSGKPLHSVVSREPLATQAAA